jgi:DNA transformation protein
MLHLLVISIGVIMAVSAEYLEYVLEQLGQVTTVRSRKMFGGAGIYQDDTMFALITSDDVLHLKADDSNRADFLAQDMPQFFNMPYYQLPVEVLEDSEALRLWVNKAIEVAIATKKPKKEKKK